MERANFQRILTLVDTIHDYKASSRGNLMDAKVFQEALFAEIQTKGINIPKRGTKERPKHIIIIENILNKDDDFYVDLQKLKDGQDEDIELPYYIEEFIADFPKATKEKLVELLKLIQKPPKNMPYNPNRLIETLMLVFIHDGFRESLGLSQNQHYIKDKKTDCSNTNKIYNNMTAKDFCEFIYADTYPANNLSRSISKLEEKILELTLKYTGYYTNNKEVSPFEAMNSLTSSSYIKIRLGKKNPAEGIYTNIDSSEDNFLNIVRKFYDTDEVAFAYDSNGIENTWMENNRYKGLFVDYDSLNQDPKVKMVKKKEKVNDDEDFLGGAGIVLKEFQQYKLTKKNNELILFDNVSIVKNQSDFVAKLSLANQTKEVKTETRSKGLPLFLRFFDEITKRTLGYKNISTSNFIKDQLSKGLKKLCLEEFKQMYKITLDELDENEDEYVALKKEDFIKALFDIKRSMDYLYVKACCTANMREKLAVNPGFRKNALATAQDLPKKQQKKFIFVSLDKSAIAYALMLNTPCILTTTQGGYKYIELFNPEEVFHNYDEILDEYKNVNAKNNRQNTTKNAKTIVQNAIETAKESPEFTQLLNLLNNVKFIAPSSIKLGQGTTEYKLNECDSWTLPPRSKQYSTIMKKICEDYKANRSNMSGGNIQQDDSYDSEDETNDIGIMDQQIPLNDPLSFAEFGSPFYMFLQFYSQLSPSIDFFWFMTFKTYFMTKLGDTMDRVVGEEGPERPRIPRSMSANASRRNATTAKTSFRRNAISNPGIHQNDKAYRIQKIISLDTIETI